MNEKYDTIIRTNFDRNIISKMFLKSLGEVFTPEKIESLKQYKRYEFFLFVLYAEAQAISCNLSEMTPRICRKHIHNQYENRLKKLIKTVKDIFAKQRGAKK